MSQQQSMLERACAPWQPIRVLPVPGTKPDKFEAGIDFMKIVEEDKPAYVCRFLPCDKPLKASLSSVKKHLADHYKASEKWYCGGGHGCKGDKPFASKQLAYHHYANVHLHLKLYKCQHDGCDGAFSDQSAVNKHRKINHEPQVRYEYTCYMCFGTFNHRSDEIRRHELRCRKQTALSASSEFSLPELEQFNQYVAVMQPTPPESPPQAASSASSDFSPEDLEQFSQWLAAGLSMPLELPPDVGTYHQPEA